MLQPDFEQTAVQGRLARVSEMVDEFRTLTALPEVVRRALALLEDPNARPAQVAEAIKPDRALAGQVLRLANSAYYAAARQFISVEDAVIRIGFGPLKGVLLAAAAVDPMRQSLPLYRVPPGEIWSHSVASAVAARMIAARLGYADLDEAYVAALLHEVGMPVVNRLVSPEEAEAIRGHVEREQLPYHEAERIVLGFDHGLVGAMLLRRWGIDTPIVTSVLEHHRPFFGQGRERLGGITHLADVVALLALSKPSGGGWLYPADAEAVEDLRFDPADMHGLMQQLQRAMARIERFVGLA